MKRKPPCLFCNGKEENMNETIKCNLEWNNFLNDLIKNLSWKAIYS